MGSRVWFGFCSLFCLSVHLSFSLEACSLFIEMVFERNHKTTESNLKLWLGS